jgi:peptidoglycan/xylan/chitin deacetylase (PgdA/CDA1 family)
MLTVSNYHYIRETFDHKYPSIFGVTPSQFENQIRLLKQSGNFIKISDFLDHTEEVLSSKDNHYLITFDDGLKEQYEYAIPIMASEEVDGLFFINTINHEQKKVSTVHKIHLLRSVVHPKEMMLKILENYPFDYQQEEKESAYKTYRFDTKESAEIKYFLNFLMSYEEKEKLIKELFVVYFDEKVVTEQLYMSEQQIKELAKKRYIGNHTHSHKPLGLFDQAMVEYELAHSKQFLEQMTGNRISAVSYPYGNAIASSELVQKKTKETGHKIGFTAMKGINKEATNLFALSRFDCNDLIGGKNYDYKRSK